MEAVATQSAAPPPSSPWTSRLAVAVLVIALSVIVGWVLDIRLLKSVLPAWTTMKINTALGFLCCAAALWLSRSPASFRRYQWVCLALCAIVTTISLITLAEYAFHTDYGIDEWLVSDPEHAGTSYPPGRLAPSTAVSFLLFSAALLVLDSLPDLSQSITLLMSLVSLLSLVGYLYGLSTVSGAAHYTSMALHTLTSFLLLAFGLWSARRHRGWVALLLRPEGLRTRQLLFTAVGLPLLLGFLCLSGQKQGWYDFEFTLALFTVLLIVLTTVVIAWTAHTGNSLEWQRKVAEQALRTSEQRFRELADAMPQIVWTATPQGQLTYFNERWFRVTGIERGGPVRQDWQKTLHPEDAVEAHRTWKQAMDTGQPYECEFRRWDARFNEYRWYLSRAEPVLNPDGTVQQWYGTATDIEDVKRAQGEVLQLNHELESRVAQRTAELHIANQELESFSYSVSHDLRAPLRSMDSFSRFLIEDYGDRLDDEGRRYLERIRSNAQRMGQLIHDLLALSRLSRTELRREPVHLSSLVTGVIDELRQRSPGRAVAVYVHPDLIVLGDSRLLRVALENLIGNAWKFTSKTSHPEIEFGILEEPERTYLIRDNGAGFDMRFVSQLFSPFQRLHQATEFEGTGIGLATVQRVIQRHGGRIWAEGEVGTGATFYFTLGLHSAGEGE